VTLGTTHPELRIRQEYFYPMFSNYSQCLFEAKMAYPLSINYREIHLDLEMKATPEGADIKGYVQPKLRYHWTNIGMFVLSCVRFK
jgi:hypothetical protein